MGLVWRSSLRQRRWLTYRVMRVRGWAWKSQVVCCVPIASIERVNQRIAIVHHRAVVISKGWTYLAYQRCAAMVVINGNNNLKLNWPSKVFDSYFLPRYKHPDSRKPHHACRHPPHNLQVPRRDVFSHDRFFRRQQKNHDQ